MKTTNNLILSLMLLALFHAPQAIAQNTYYVSTSGNDANAGSLASPWRNIQKAASVMQAGDKCFIRGGTYREKVTPTNSGSAGSPITFEGYGSEEVIVSGFDVVNSAWTLHAGNIYKTTITLGLGDKNQVFMDGNWSNLARYPNDTDLNPFTLNAATVNKAASNKTQINDASMPLQGSGALNGAVVWCMAFKKWTAWGTTVTSSGGGTINFTIPGDPWIRDNQDPGQTAGSDNNFYILSNKLELLDAAGEWYYNSNTLYAWVNGGGNPGTKVGVRQRELAFDLADKSYIQINKLKIKGAGVKVTGNNNTLDNITGTYLNHHTSSGMSWNHPATMYGIYITGNNNVVKNSNFSYSAGPLIEITGSANLVDNNYIRYADYNCSYDAGILLSTGGGNKIYRNTLSHGGRSLMHLGVPSGANYIKWNDLSEAMLFTDDGSFIYSGGGTAMLDFKNTELAYNKFHDMTRYNAYRLCSGLYMDDQTSNMIYHHNTVYNIGQSAVVKIGSGSVNRAVYNTTAYNCPGTFVSYHGGGSGSVANSFHNQTASHFTNAGSADFRLTSTSSAINAGSVLAPYTNGYAGSAPDLGAYEYGGPDRLSNWTAGVGSTIYEDSNPTPAPISFANPGFEANTGQAPQSWMEWTDNNSTDASYVESNAPHPAHGGNNNLTHWKATAYRVYTYQSITGLTNGSYTVKAWVKSSGGQNASVMQLKQYGGSDVSTIIPTASTYTQISREVNVTTGKIEVGFWSDANANNWINVDDVEVVASTITTTLPNPGFEADNAATQTPQNWTEWTDNNSADASFTEAKPRTGSFNLAHWKTSAYRVYTYQSITGLTNGSYTVKAWVKSSGGQNAAAMQLKQYGGSDISTAITASSTYTQISRGVNVTTGKIEVGFWSDANANNWINVDDVEIVSGCTGCRSAGNSQAVAEQAREEEESEKDSFTVYPNPITSASVISYRPKEDGVIDVSIMHVQGHQIRKVFNGQVKKELEYRFEIGLKDSAPGLYIATVASSTGIAHRKIWIGQ
jgi:hypothetical protein